MKLSEIDLSRVRGGAAAVVSEPLPGGGVSIDWSDANQGFWNDGIGPDHVFEPGTAGDALPGGYAVA
jgi:hypothetical protein